MHCPSCNTSTVLKPVKLNSNLSARKCVECGGLLIDLIAYRVWRERWPESEVSTPNVTEVAENSKALLCPKCSGVMLKFKIGTDTPNTIDVCTHCSEAWLDEGEWELLGSLALQTKLTNIFTQPWQRRIRVEQVENSQARRNEALVGSEAMAKVVEIVAWVENHPKKDDVLRILRGKLC